MLVGYFGLLNRTKGVAELIETVGSLPQRFKLVIIGGGAATPEDQRYADEVQALITDRQLKERVLITGTCSEAEVSAHLLAADMVALPFQDGASYRRGSLLAALNHGVPTITTTPATPLEPPLLDKTHALLLSSSNVDTLRNAILTLADNRALREQLAVEGRALAAYFDWSSIAAKHEQVYHTLLEAQSRRT
jgi:glycosyltransferase involved in cell wall biosynthesis